MTLKDLNGRLARGSSALHFNIEHRKGKDNIVADMLSWPNEAAEVKLFNFETTEFENEYLERLQLIEEHGTDRFPDLRVEEGLLLKKTHFNSSARGYGKDLSKTPAYVLPVQNGSSSPRHTTQLKRAVMGNLLLGRSTHSKVVPGFPRKVSAVSSRKYNVIHRVGSPNQVCVASLNLEFRKQSIRTPQYNASERVNQSVLAAIRVNIQDDHTRWDEHLADKQASQRSFIHNSTGTSPNFVMFRQHMFTNGVDYSLACKWNALNEAEIAQLPRSFLQQLYREKIKERIHQAYEKAAKRYNLKAREVRYSPGIRYTRETLS